MSNIAEPNRNAPLELWHIARAMMRALYALFGEPQNVAARRWILRKDARMLSGWLRAAKALLRRLLLIEATLLAPQTLGPIRPRPPRAPRQRRLMEFTEDDPDAWRVSFRLTDSAFAPTSTLPRPRAPRRLFTAPGLKYTWPLAERYEALLRAYNEPLIYARRLARRLARTPALAAHMLAPTTAVKGHICDEDFGLVSAAAKAAFPASRQDSS